MAKSAGKTYTYNDVVADIRAGKFAPIYLLQGEEPYYIDKVVDWLGEKVVADPEARDFDLYNFFGADTDVRKVIDTARQFPLMGEKQLVMLRETQAMHNARNEIEKLAGYAKHPVSSTVLVVSFKGEPLKASSAFIKAIKECGGVIFTSEKVKEWQLDKIVSEYCKEKGIKIDAKSAQMLKDFIGNDLSRLFSEIDKLIVATNGATITPEAIERNIGISKDFNNFELINALAAKDYARCMRIVDYFEKNPKQNPVVMTVALMFRFFSNLMLAWYAPEKSERGIMSQLGFHSPYQLKDITIGMQRYSARSTLNIIHELRLLDCKSKGIGSMQKDYSQLKEFIFKAFTV
ncbi:MAG: DNA polymerase III subunit delta [Prevotella sp.]|nr:DNA polymerase III subunit delta [Prevotella sp.]MCM1075514.1 DNA polymerase III subunit delta [Ruminococcus sp.]